MSDMSGNQKKSLSMIAEAAAAISSEGVGVANVVPSSSQASSSNTPSSSSDTSSSSSGGAGTALLVLPPNATATVRPEWNDYPMEGITEPHKNDVLCGRGGGSNNHSGNESFRELVNRVKCDYLGCPKRQKPVLAMRIVQAVRAQSPPGRFLQHDKSTESWSDIGDKKAREKSSQALREGAPLIRDMVQKPSPSVVANIVKDARKVARKNDNKKSLPMAVDLPMAMATAKGSSSLTSSSAVTRPNLFQPSFESSRRVTAAGGGLQQNGEPVLFEIVRGLLLGYVDPVLVASSILSREEAAIVAQRHQFSRPLPNNMMLPAMEVGTEATTPQISRTTSSSSYDQSETESSSNSPNKRSQPDSSRTPLKKRKVVVDV